MHRGRIRTASGAQAAIAASSDSRKRSMGALYPMGIFAETRADGVRGRKNIKKKSIISFVLLGNLDDSSYTGTQHAQPRARRFRKHARQGY
jgi:hypothetical protein